jgi:hypothetical protein
MFLMQLPELQSVAANSRGETGLSRVIFRNDHGVQYIFLVFLLYEFYNVRMSQAAEGKCFKIHDF